MLAIRSRLVLAPAVLAVVLAAGLAAQAQQGGMFSRTRNRVSTMEVLDRVYSRLHWEKALTTSSLEVEVQPGGVVLLRGVAPDARAKAKAVELTRNTTGVIQVVDEVSLTDAAADPTSPAPVVRPGR